jgi:hypothetical protein
MRHRRDSGHDDIIEKGKRGQERAKKCRYAISTGSAFKSLESRESGDRALRLPAVPGWVVEKWELMGREALRLAALAQDNSVSVGHVPHLRCSMPYIPPPSAFALG